MAKSIVLVDFIVLTHSYTGCLRDVGEEQSAKH